MNLLIMRYHSFKFSPTASFDTLSDRYLITPKAVTGTANAKNATYYKWPCGFLPGDTCAN